MSKKHVIAIDAMGGDNAPTELVKGTVNSLSINEDINFILVGDEVLIKKELETYVYDKNRIDIIHASEVIETHESPTVAIKNKKDSSMIVGLKLLKERKASAIISAGNTGALLTGATLTVGRIKGIKRPALGTLIPNEKGFTFLVDSGANVDCKPEYLVQFAKMGSVYMENVLGIKQPKVGIINIGVEKEKGNALTKEAYEMLANADLNFVGNIEARDISKGVVDVLVCDGFVGNIILKYTEGFAKSIFTIIKEEITSSNISKIGAMLSGKSFKAIKKRFDYSDIGGAPFLGLKGLVIKTHGSAEAKDIVGSVNQAYMFINNNMVEKIEKEIF